MNTSPNVEERVAPTQDTADDHRARMLEGIPVREDRRDLAGIPTALLVGGRDRPSSSCTAPASRP